MVIMGQLCQNPTAQGVFWQQSLLLWYLTELRAHSEISALLPYLC